MEKKRSRCYCIINSLDVAHLIPLSSTVNYSAFIGGASLTLSGGVQLVEPLKDIRDHERRRPGGAVLSGDVGLLSEARGHVVHDGHDDAHWLLGHRDTLGQLQLWDQTRGEVRGSGIRLMSRAYGESLPRLTKKSILDLSTTAMVPGGAMGGALGGMVRQNWTFHFSCAAWSGNCRERFYYLVSYKHFKCFI